MKHVCHKKVENEKLIKTEKYTKIKEPRVVFIVVVFIGVECIIEPSVTDLRFAYLQPWLLY